MKKPGIMNVKKTIFSILVFIGIFISCEKKDNYLSTGVITGPDIRECICCGGYFIEIEDTTYNFDALPMSSQIDLATDTFPINVNLDWSYDRDCGGIQYIDISKIERQ